ncbi:UNVERIFIED_CONTAM: Retrovirus-related Pol polyprotein from transposon RE2 [Sesamum calycinum]|uniref:Retrovirus-related Pol polyprotein from transposon RE2 n=1 Tax=Sesamum calycinum TaxID=2727403 RepID=A0AAW2M2L0_9LAMI
MRQRPKSLGRWYWSGRLQPLKQKARGQTMEDEEGKAKAAASALSAPVASVGMGKGKGKVDSKLIKANDEISRKLNRDEVVLKLGDGKAVAAEAVETIHFTVSDQVRIKLKDCYYVPSMIKNIICISLLDNVGFEFMINKNYFYLMNNGSSHLLGKLHNGLYILQQHNLVMTAQNKHKMDNQENRQIWHPRLGHTARDRIKVGRLKKSTLFPPVLSERKNDQEALCRTKYACQRSVGFDLSDICGPLNTQDRGGFSYFITFIDDHSRYGYVYLMRYKSEVFGRFKEFKPEVENQTNRKIIALRLDRGGEYLSGEFLDYLKENGILSQCTPLGTPQLNGVSKRMNQILLDIVLSMMSFTKLSLSFWGYALVTTTKLSNMAPSKTVAQTPYHIWHDKPASYKYLRVWDSPAYVKRLVGDKLDSRSSLCRLVGYPKETSGYYFYDPSEQKIHPRVFRPLGVNGSTKVSLELTRRLLPSRLGLWRKGILNDFGVDFEETYSPVAMAKSILIMLATVVWYNNEIWQMDIKTAFLNGFVEEEIYVNQSEGFTCVREEQKVCHLQRSIYGLKQASRSWNIRFDEVIRGYNFIKNDFDPCIYNKVSGRSVAFLVLYVDDIMLIRNDVKMLGIKNIQDRSKRMLGMTQTSYVEKVLKRFKMENSKRGFLPMRHGVKLSKKQSPKTDEEFREMFDIPYTSVVGNIQYVVQFTRPDVTFTLSVTSTYQACAGLAHWTAVKTILKYLRRIKNMFLVYDARQLILEDYNDVNF